MAMSLASVRCAAPAGVRMPVARRVPRIATFAAGKTPGSGSSSSSGSSSTPDLNIDTDKLLKQAAEAWDKVEDKTSVVVYGTGAIAVLWISSAVISAINGIPLVPKFLELIGLGYTGWFTYRYLLFKTSRKELMDDIEELKKKITGGSA